MFKHKLAAIIVIFYLLSIGVLVSPQITFAAVDCGGGRTAPSAQACPAANPAAKTSPSTSASPSSPTSGGNIRTSGGTKCSELIAVNAISEGGFVRYMCSLSTDPNQNVIQVMIQQTINWLSGIAVILFMIMIALAGLQITSSGGSPEGIKGGKRRLTLAASSLALIFAGQLFLGLTGLYGTTRTIIGVPVDNFSYNTVLLLIDRVLVYIQFLSGALSVIFVIVGGIRMMTSAGNPSAIQGARKTITYALIGLGITIGLGLIYSVIKLVITGS
ncbi:MAG: hypothetical protein WCI47_03210 [bacterium]